MKRLVRRLLSRFGDPNREFNSLPLREAYRRQGLEVGLHTYGCFDIARFPPGITIGRYSSFAPTARVFLRNHGLPFLAQTPYFYNKQLGLVAEDKFGSASMTFSDDVWVGHNAILLPSVGTVGRGSVIAAGAVVTKPVPPYAVVAGNPARIVRMRFDDETIARIEETRWWELDPPELGRVLRETPELIYEPVAYFAKHGTVSLARD